MEGVKQMTMIVLPVVVVFAVVAIQTWREHRKGAAEYEQEGVQTDGQEVEEEA